MVVEANILVPQIAPNAFDKDVVKHSTAAVYTNGNNSVEQTIPKIWAGQLAALIGVKDFRRPERESCIEGFVAECVVEDIGQSPGQNIATVPIDDRHEIHRYLGHRDIGDLGAPDLITFAPADD